jgi:hypothetical protein
MMGVGGLDRVLEGVRVPVPVPVIVPAGTDLMIVMMTEGVQRKNPQ